MKRKIDFIAGKDLKTREILKAKQATQAFRKLTSAKKQGRTRFEPITYATL